MIVKGVIIHMKENLINEITQILDECDVKLLEIIKNLIILQAR